MNKKNFLIRRLLIHTNMPFDGNGADLRRAVTACFKDIPVLHNHNGAGFDYRSPRVRYLVVKGVPQIVSFGSGATIVEYLYRKRFDLRVADCYYKITGVELVDDLVTVGGGHELMSYESQTPWLALNQKNNAIYCGFLKQIERRHFLERILVGNYLSLCKTLGIFLEERVTASLDDWKQIDVSDKGISMRGFIVKYHSNMLLPFGLGLGKWVAKGFGLMNVVKEREVGHFVSAGLKKKEL
ncbi:MAG: hypothetical protein IBX61_05690 [Thermoleophilia bacterium]|nr:hypothetical protein [Thermoleophilia bacterium]